MNEFKELVLTLNPDQKRPHKNWHEFRLFREHIHLFQRYEYDVLSSAHSLLRFLPSHTVPLLQLSGGSPALTYMLAFYGYTGITVVENPENIQMIRRVLQIIPNRQPPFLLLSRLEKLPFPDNSFPITVNFHLIRSLPDPWPILKELERVVHPEGTIIIRDLNRNGIKLMKEILNDGSVSLEPRGVSLLEVAEHFDREGKFVNCLREEFDTTLLITPQYKKI